MSLPLSGFLVAELSKAGIEPRSAGNVEAPDPQKMIDLEVSLWQSVSLSLYFTHTFSLRPSLKLWRQS